MGGLVGGVAGSVELHRDRLIGDEVATPVHDRGHACPDDLAEGVAACDRGAVGRGFGATTEVPPWVACLRIAHRNTVNRWGRPGDERMA